MKPMPIRLRIAGLASLAFVLVLHGCGGGVGTGGTGTFAQGPITGFGSIVVNGVHFDERAARIEDDDGSPRPASGLQLGMTVQVQAGPVSTLGAVATATASVVRVERALVGPASDVDAAAGRFTVLGQPVAATPDTVVDDRLAGGLAGLGDADRVEVHGSFDVANAGFVATRVGPAPAQAASQVAGPASQVDPVARTLRIGSQTYSFASLGGSGPANGAQVRLTLRGDRDSSGRWVVSSQGGAGPAPAEGVQLELRSLVQSVASPVRFTVDGLVVDASTARIDGTVTVGARAKVSGAMRSGVLVATRVSVESGGAQEFEIKGTVTALDAAARTFRLRDTTVGYARADLQFIGGSAAQLAVGRKVEVRGRLSADRSVLEATRIEFDD